MDAGMAAASLSLDALASQLRDETYLNGLKVKMDGSVLFIENIPAYAGQPQNRWILTQFFEAAYRHVGPQALGIVLKDDTGKILASNVT